MDFPREDIQYVIGFLTGTEQFEVRKGLWAIHSVLTFLLTTVLPKTAPATAATPEFHAVSYSEENLVNGLKALLAEDDEKRGGPSAQGIFDLLPIPREQLFKWVFQLILRWLDSRYGATG